MLTSLEFGGGRPLAEAADYLEVRLGIPIHYEDPPYIHASDLLDVTERVAKPEARLKNPNVRVFVPRGGKFVMQYPFEWQQRGENMSILRAAVAAYRVAGLTGAFDVMGSDRAVCIVPTQFKNGNGQNASHTSILDTKITIPEKETSVLEAVMAVTEQVSNVSPEKLVMGTVPSSTLRTHTVRIRADDEPARDVLLRMLKEMKRFRGVTSPPSKCSWRVFFAPIDKFYVLNIHIVMKEVDSPFGGKVTEPL
jgi:hypothetical protein